MDIGTSLRHARERAGLSREQIASATKIKLERIVALEDNAFEQLPGGIYLEGMIRAYAHEVGADPAPFLRQLHSSRPDVTSGPSVSELAHAVETKHHPQAAHAARRGSNTAALTALVSLVLLAFAAGGYLFTSSSRPAQREADTAEEGAVGTSGRDAGDRAADSPEPPPQSATASSEDAPPAVPQARRDSDAPQPPSASAAAPQPAAPDASAAPSAQERADAEARHRERAAADALRRQRAEAETLRRERAAADALRRQRAAAETRRREAAAAATARTDDAPRDDQEERSRDSDGGARDVNGSWAVATRIDRSNVRDFQGLQLGYVLNLRQDGDRVVGAGRKVSENGTRLHAAAQTPISVVGTMEGDRLMLTFTERGMRRDSSGTLVFRVGPDGSLRGSFSSDAARSSGAAAARRRSGTQ